MLESLSGAMVGLFLNLIIMGGGVLFFIWLDKQNQSKKSNTDNSTVLDSKIADAKVATTNTTPAPAPKKKDPYARLNILLYIGSFLLVAAMLGFIANEEDSLVAPTTIILTTLFYLGGIAIYKLVPYLKNVGKSFAYTAAVIFPFWAISLIDMGIETQGSLIISGLITLVVLVSSAVIFKSKIVATLSYLWLIVLIEYVNPFITYIKDGQIASTWATSAPIAISLLPTIFWVTKPKWLPVSFRKATQVFAYLLVPLFFVLSLIFFLIPDFTKIAGFARSVVAMAFFLYGVLHWLRTKDYRFFAVARIGLQSLIFAIVCDATNFSIINGWSVKSTSVVPILVWVACSLAQALISLLVRKDDEKKVRVERWMEIIAIASISISPILSDGLSAQQSALLNMAIFATVSILGIAYTYIHKNIRWIIATMIGLIFIPASIRDAFSLQLSDWANYAYFFLYGAMMLGVYQTTRKQQPKDSFWISFSGIVIAGIAMLITSVGESFIEIGWLGTAALLALFGYVSNKKWLLETSIYAGALSIFSLLSTIQDSVTTSRLMSNCVSRSTANCLSSQPSYTESLFTVLRVYMLPIALLITSFLYERKKEHKSKVRFIIAYCILSTCLFLAGLDDATVMLVNLVTQVGFLVYAALKDISAYIWSSIILIIISVLALTDGITYISFGVIGLILILIVVWRLVKLNKTKAK